MRPVVLGQAPVQVLGAALSLASVSRPSAIAFAFISVHAIPHAMRERYLRMALS